MKNDKSNIDSNVDELLSGYIDGELTQQQRQLVELHCEQCADTRHLLDELTVLRARVGDVHLSELGEDKWREHMNDSPVQLSRGIGWLLFIGGLLIIGGIVIYQFFADTSITLGWKVLIAAVYGGLAALFVSVLRQRLIERKTDKYKDVEI